LGAVKEATAWLEMNGATATAEDFSEQKERLSEVAHGVTNNLYGSYDDAGGQEHDDPRAHDEL